MNLRRDKIHDGCILPTRRRELHMAFGCNERVVVCNAAACERGVGGVHGGYPAHRGSVGNHLPESHIRELRKIHGLARMDTGAKNELYARAG